MKSKTAYLGDEYSYSHAAAERMSHGELRAYSTMSETIAAVGKDCDYEVLPVENNVEGAVNEVYDAFFDSGLFIERELVLPVRHSLIVADGVTLDQVHNIGSNPEAIAQCRKYLSGLGVPVVAVASTSAALAAVQGGTAAIAFRPKAGQTAIASGIQDSAMNATRFALLTRERTSNGGTVSVAFDLRNEPGALLEVLGTVNAHGINLTRILSRPHRDGSGKYRFFIDFDFGGTEKELGKLFDEIERSCSDFRFLGRYDCLTATDF
ncbi:MAG: ACT domain-containing protein [Clostridiales bacterium]|nr:ACT domain-containing protein [Clostridiales bacterium]